MTNGKNDGQTTYEMGRLVEEKVKAPPPPQPCPHPTGRHYSIAYLCYDAKCSHGFDVYVTCRHPTWPIWAFSQRSPLTSITTGLSRCCSAAAAVQHGRPPALDALLCLSIGGLIAYRAATKKVSHPHLSTSHLSRHSRFSDNDSRPFCFPVPTKALSYDSSVTITIHHYCLDTCGPCNN